MAVGFLFLLVFVLFSGKLIISVSGDLSRSHSTHANGNVNDDSISECQQLDPSPELEPFVDALPLPPIIDGSTGNQIVIGAYKISQKLHRDLPNTTLYAFGTSQQDAIYPGPTIVAKQNIPTYIRWENHIPDAKHMFTVDNTITWANPSRGGVPMVTHLHGAEVESIYDGHPEAWFTPYGETGPTFHSHDHTYINQQSAAALWYHDHTIGITRLNVASGLAGMYIIASDKETENNISLGIPLIIHDRQFYSNGSLNFPNIGIIPDSHPQWCPEYFGDTILVNGKAWPYLKVLRQAYRFRLLNSCNARFLNLSLSDNSISFQQIGTDGGFVHDGPWNLSTLIMAPAERIDVLIDFSKVENGSKILLRNSGATPYPTGQTDTQPPGAFIVMAFLVVDDGLEDGIVELPIDVDALIDEDEMPLKVEDVALSRFLSVVEYDDSNHLPLQFTLDNKTWEDPVVQLPNEGDTELWELMNLRINAHPLHVHLTSFQMLNQQEFSDVNYENGQCSLDIPYPENGTCYRQYPQDPLDFQKGWKDTLILYPAVITRVLIRFTQRNGSTFSFDPSVGPGYIWHCHVVDHEDNVMMRPFRVIRNNSSYLLKNTISINNQS